MQWKRTYSDRHPDGHDTPSTLHYFAVTDAEQNIPDRTTKFLLCLDETKKKGLGD
jgi:hypothetical protein